MDHLPRGTNDHFRQLLRRSSSVWSCAGFYGVNGWNSSCRRRLFFVLVRHARWSDGCIRFPRPSTPSRPARAWAGGERGPTPPAPGGSVRMPNLHSRYTGVDRDSPIGGGSHGWDPSASSLLRRRQPGIAGLSITIDSEPLHGRGSEVPDATVEPFDLGRSVDHERRPVRQIGTGCLQRSPEVDRAARRWPSLGQRRST
jgi:hypothetical protein